MTNLAASSALGGNGASELFELLRDGIPRTRAELATISGLARSTVAARIEALTALGLVGPVDNAVSTGGRPSSQVALLPNARVVLAVDIGASHIEVALADLNGKLLLKRREQIEVADGPERVLGWVTEAGRDLLEEQGCQPSDLLAIGVGVPGPVEFSTGRPINQPIMPGWNRFDVRGWLQQSWDIPVLVDNDVNLSALGEREVAWPDTQHMLFVKVATGIGAGVISGGRLQRGAQGTAGDIGHVQIPRGAGVPCRCGNQGCLGAMASGPAIARGLRERGIDVSGTAELIELVARGDVDAVQAIRQAGRDIGEVLTVCVSLINPSVIAIGGSVAAAGEHLIAGIREVVYSASMPLASEHLTIVQSAAGADATVIGAGVLAIHHALSPENIVTLTG